jgi:hypothetical protein
MQITDEEYSKLKADSIMLSQIAGYVEDFCEDEHDTTLIAVVTLLTDYYYLKSEELGQTLTRLKRYRIN